MYLADVILTGVIRHDSVVREAKVHNILLIVTTESHLYTVLHVIYFYA